MTPYLALLHLGFVDRDLDQPGAELGLLAEAGEILKALRIASWVTSSPSASFLSSDNAARKTARS
jgi:hypothetical protein